MIADWFAGREVILAMTVLINAWPVGICLALFGLPIVGRILGLPAVFSVAAAGAGLAAVA